MLVFVLLESGESTPLGVFDTPRKPYLLPADCKSVREEKGDGHHYVHREVVNQWTSQGRNSIYSLVAYVIQKP